MPNRSDTNTFEEFFERAEPLLRDALSATVGTSTGLDAAADALSYGWEHWERVRDMENPIGYLYVVGRDRARRRQPKRAAMQPVDREQLPWVEPDLPDALARLPEQQRTVVMLVHCYQWTMSEVAQLLDVSKSTVQTHAERGIGRLRDDLKVMLSVPTCSTNSLRTVPSSDARNRHSSSTA